MCFSDLGQGAKTMSPIEILTRGPEHSRGSPWDVARPGTYTGPGRGAPPLLLAASRPLSAHPLPPSLQAGSAFWVRAIRAPGRTHIAVCTPLCAHAPVWVCRAHVDPLASQIVGEGCCGWMAEETKGL